MWRVWNKNNSESDGGGLSPVLYDNAKHSVTSRPARDARNVRSTTHSHGGLLSWLRQSSGDSSILPDGEPTVDGRPNVSGSAAAGSGVLWDDGRTASPNATALQAARAEAAKHTSKHVSVESAPASIAAGFIEPLLGADGPHRATVSSPGPAAKQAWAEAGTGAGYRSGRPAHRSSTTTRQPRDNPASDHVRESFKQLAGSLKAGIDANGGPACPGQVRAAEAARSLELLWTTADPAVRQAIKAVPGLQPYLRCIHRQVLLAAAGDDVVFTVRSTGRDVFGPQHHQDNAPTTSDGAATQGPSHRHPGTADELIAMSPSSTSSAEDGPSAGQAGTAGRAPSSRGLGHRHRTSPFPESNVRVTRGHGSSGQLQAQVSPGRLEADRDKRRSVAWLNARIVHTSPPHEAGRATPDQGAGTDISLQSGRYGQDTSLDSGRLDRGVSGGLGHHASFQLSHQSSVSEGFDGFEEYAAELDREDRGDRGDRDVLGALDEVDGRGQGMGRSRRSGLSGMELDRGIRLEVIPRQEQHTAQEPKLGYEAMPGRPFLSSKGSDCHEDVDGAASSGPRLLASLTSAVSAGTTLMYGQQPLVSSNTRASYIMQEATGLASQDSSSREDSSTGVGAASCLSQTTAFAARPGPARGSTVEHASSSLNPGGSSPHAPTGHHSAKPALALPLGRPRAVSTTGSTTGPRAGQYGSPASSPAMPGSAVSVPRLSFVLPSPVRCVNTSESSEALPEAQVSNIVPRASGARVRPSVRALSLSMSFSFQEEFVAQVTRAAMEEEHKLRQQHEHATSAAAQPAPEAHAIGPVESSARSMADKLISPAARAMLQELHEMPTMGQDASSASEDMTSGGHVEPALLSPRAPGTGTGGPQP